MKMKTSSYIKYMSQVDLEEGKGKCKFTAIPCILHVPRCSCELSWRYFTSSWCVIHKQALFFLLLHKSAMFFAPTLHNFITYRPHILPCCVISQEWWRKNEGLLPSEKEENQTFVRDLILSSNAHNESSYLSLHHGGIQ